MRGALNSLRGEVQLLKRKMAPVRIENIPAVCALIRKMTIFASAFGVLAQLVERQVRNLKVRGSIPLCSTNEEVR